MKCIIAGSRDVDQYIVVADAIAESGFQITEVVSGTARGVDTLGERWARIHSVPVRRFPADWSKHRKSAGPIRNQQMADYVRPDGGLIAVWNGVSVGTAHMIRIAQAAGLKVHVYRTIPLGVCEHL